MHLSLESEQPGCCAYLKKSRYRLKQSPRHCYDRLTGYLIPLDYRPINFDPCVLIQTRLQIIMAIFVNNITIFGADTRRTELKEAQKSEFNLI